MANPWDDWLNGNTGIGNTGRGDPGPLGPAPSAAPAVSSGMPDWGDVERQLRANAGNLYDPTDLEGVQRNWERLGVEGALGEQSKVYDRRDPSRTTQQRSGVSRGSGGVAPPGFQFDDPYTNLLEQISQLQLGEVRSNPGLDALMQQLTQQFSDLSTNPGYSPSERALLHTQAFEPIEANRQASMQRARERAGARGFAPSSGLMELDLRDIERAADQSRTVADRDLAISGLDRRDRDLSRALDLGQLMGVTIPRQQRQEEIGLGNLLYQLPRTAMQDAQSVINGSPSSSDAFSQAIQLLQQQYNQQGRADANNSALYGQIGQMLAGLFG